MSASPPNTGESAEGDAFRRRLLTVLGVILLAALLGPMLPTISLDSVLADGFVLVTDTATWRQLTLLSTAALLMLVSRSRIPPRRRIIEAVAIAVVLWVVLAGSAQLNEHAIKPWFGVPRPNIVTLVDAGALGPEFSDAAAFYASGDKEARRAILRNRLAGLTTPRLSDQVSAHWAHAAEYSFPSGHSMAAVAFATTLAALGLAWLGDGWRRSVAVIGLPIWAVAVVYSRLLLEVHSVVDVVAGTLAGFIWGGVGFWLIRQSVERLAEGTSPGITSAGNRGRGRPAGRG